MIWSDETGQDERERERERGGGDAFANVNSVDNNKQHHEQY